MSSRARRRRDRLARKRRFNQEVSRQLKAENERRNCWDTEIVKAGGDSARIVNAPSLFWLNQNGLNEIRPDNSIRRS